MSRLFRAIAFAATIIVLALIVFPVAAQIKPIIDCNDLGIPCIEARPSQPARPLGEYIVAVINVFLFLAAIIAAVFIIIGGVQYIFSAGDDRKASTAKSTILYAIIGLIVIALAASIVRFTTLAIGIAGEDGGGNRGGGGRQQGR